MSRAPVHAQLDYQLPGGGDAIWAEVDAGEPYLVSVERPAGAPVGGNDFYVIKLRLDSLTLVESEPNDTHKLASSFGNPGLYDPKRYESRPVGLLPSGDVDWWWFPADAGATIEIDCGASRWGSGLRDATFTLYEPCLSPGCSDPESIIWTEVETLGMPLLFSGTTSRSGAHLLAVTATTYDPDVSSVFYRCDIVVVNPS